MALAAVGAAAAVAVDVPRGAAPVALAAIGDDEDVVVAELVSADVVEEVGLLARDDDQAAAHGTQRSRSRRTSKGASSTVSAVPSTLGPAALVARSVVSAAGAASVHVTRVGELRVLYAKR